jgi:hypothetical protein
MLTDEDSRNTGSHQHRFSSHQPSGCLHHLRPCSICRKKAQSYHQSWFLLEMADSALTEGQPGHLLHVKCRWHTSWVRPFEVLRLICQLRHCKNVLYGWARVLALGEVRETPAVKYEEEWSEWESPETQGEKEAKFFVHTTYGRGTSTARSNSTRP